MPSHDIADIAVQIYRCYKIQAGYYGSQYTWPFKRHERIWTASAEVVADNQFDVEKFVQAQFLCVDPADRRTASPPILLPSRTLAADRYRRSFPKQQQSSGGDLAKFFVGMRGTLARLARYYIPKHHSDVSALLEQPEYSFTAWFRILSAPNPSPRMYRMYLEDAIGELADNQELRTYLEENSERYGFDLKRLERNILR